MKHYPIAHEIQRYSKGQSVDLSDLYEKLTFEFIDVAFLNEYINPEKTLTDGYEIEVDYPRTI